MVVNIIANGAAISALGSVAIEAGAMAKRRASRASKTAVAIKDIKDYSGDATLNKSSDKHNSMKKYVRNSQVLTNLTRAKGAVTGFLSGITEGMKGNIPTTIFSIVTLASKRREIKVASTVLMGCSMAWDFIKNGTNLFADRKIIEK